MTRHIGHYQSGFSCQDIGVTEGVPVSYLTNRTELVAKLVKRLYPETKQEMANRCSVLFIKAPPCSGKTGLAQLLARSLSTTCSVVMLRGNHFDQGLSVRDIFKKYSGREDLEDFLMQAGKNVLILDEAQCSYEDSSFWKVIVKRALGSEYPDARIILCSSFGSFNPYMNSNLPGTPCVIPRHLYLGLMQTNWMPGLALMKHEFDEMVRGSLMEESKEILWSFCSNHIGIARAVITYIENYLVSIGTFTIQQVQKVLFSNKLLIFLSQNRGMPTLESFGAAVLHAVDAEDARRLRLVLDRVSQGERVSLRDQARSPGSANAVDLLLKHGFLFLDEEDYLHFASEMHQKVWLHSLRTDAIISLSCYKFEDFLPLAISRMHSSRLMKFNETSGSGVVRERQIQMEFYSAIVSLLPKSSYVVKLLPFLFRVKCQLR